MSTRRKADRLVGGQAFAHSHSLTLTRSLTLRSRTHSLAHLHRECRLNKTRVYQDVRQLGEEITAREASHGTGFKETKREASACRRDLQHLQGDAQVARLLLGRRPGEMTEGGQKQEQKRPHHEPLPLHRCSSTLDTLACLCAAAFAAKLQKEVDTYKITRSRLADDDWHFRSAMPRLIMILNGVCVFVCLCVSFLFLPFAFPSLPGEILVPKGWAG